MSGDSKRIHTPIDILLRTVSHCQESIWPDWLNTKATKTNFLLKNKGTLNMEWLFSLKWYR